MIYYTIPPSPLLADYVRFFWVLECDILPNSPYVYRSIADGCVELLFHYKGKFSEIYNGVDPLGGASFSMVQGQSQRFRRFETNQSFGIFGAYLYPYSIPKLFAYSSTDFSNQMPDLESFTGKEGKELEEKILLAPNNENRYHILTDYLERLIKTSYSFDQRISSSIKYIIESKGKFNVQQLSDQFCLSSRQFERKFKIMAGFSPKLYTRIIRFQSATFEIIGREKSLTEIAHLSGYYDQSHFIHDFKEFSGYHPKKYFSENVEGIGGLPF